MENLERCGELYPSGFTGLSSVYLPCPGHSEVKEAGERIPMDYVHLQHGLQGGSQVGEEAIKEGITLRRQRKSRNARISVEQQRKCFHTEPRGGG